MTNEQREALEEFLRADAYFKALPPLDGPSSMSQTCIHSVAASRIAPAIRALLERVGELEGGSLVEELAKANYNVDALTSRNRQLTEALEFYANPANWHARPSWNLDEESTSSMLQDLGAKARKALADALPAQGQKEGKS